MLCIGDSVIPAPVVQCLLQNSHLVLPRGLIYDQDSTIQGRFLRVIASLDLRYIVCCCGVCVGSSGGRGPEGQNEAQAIRETAALVWKRQQTSLHRVGAVTSAMGQACYWVLLRVCGFWGSNRSTCVRSNVFEFQRVAGSGGAKASIPAEGCRAACHPPPQCPARAGRCGEGALGAQGQPLTHALWANTTGATWAGCRAGLPGCS